MSERRIPTRKSTSKMTRRIASAAILTAMAVVLMYLEIPLPFFPPFLKFDFSEVPVLIGTFAIGPLYGVAIELAKNVIHLPVSHTAGIGEVSNFLNCSVFIATAGIIYSKIRTRKSALISMAIATATFALMSCPFNYFITLPLYSQVLGFSNEAIIGMSAAVNPLIHTKFDLILWGFLPFNIFKGVVISAITLVIYKPISKLINATAEKTK